MNVEEDEIPAGMVVCLDFQQLIKLIFFMVGVEVRIEIQQVIVIF